MIRTEVSENYVMANSYRLQCLQQLEKARKDLSQNESSIRKTKSLIALESLLEPVKDEDFNQAKSEFSKLEECVSLMSRTGFFEKSLSVSDEGAAEVST